MLSVGGVIAGQKGQFQASHCYANEIFVFCLFIYFFQVGHSNVNCGEEEDEIHMH